MGQGKPGKGTKRQQMLRTARETKRQRREALEVQRREELEVQRREELEEVDLPDDLLARVGIEEDSELEESEYSEDSDFEEESDCELAHGYRRGAC
jgi:hypothetical protein